MSLDHMATVTRGGKLKGNERLKQCQTPVFCSTMMSAGVYKFYFKILLQLSFKQRA